MLGDPSVLNGDSAVGVDSATIAELTSAAVVAVIDGDYVEVRDKATLDLIKRRGGTGSGNDQFSGPTHLALDADHIFVVDAGNSRVSIKRWGGVNHHAHATLAAMVIADAVGPVCVNKTAMLLARAATNGTVHRREKGTPYTAIQSPAYDCGAGTVVGVAVLLNHFLVAFSSGTVQKRRISDGAVVATWTAVDAGYTLVALACDGEYAYVAANHASNPFRVYRLTLEEPDLNTEREMDGPAGKELVAGIAVDSDTLYFTSTTDNTLNTILKDDFTGGVVKSVTLTAPAGVAVLPAHWDTIGGTWLSASVSGSASATVNVSASDGVVDASVSITHTGDATTVDSPTGEIALVTIAGAGGTTTVEASVAEGASVSATGAGAVIAVDSPMGDAAGVTSSGTGATTVSASDGVGTPQRGGFVTVEVSTDEDLYVTVAVQEDYD